ncbi:hypothetical protein PENSPDRAFT_666476 [Peniophora sp. CONT]|nr:hypothetical protein PENSPDRAFT_666476 [Peniophora sp. CONT]
MDVEEPDWETITRNLFKNYTIQLVPGVILFYDYFLTLDEEVTHYWQRHRPFTWISILFLATRYVTLLSFTPVFISMLTGNATLGCGVIQDFHNVFEIILQVPVGCLCTIRVYALYSQDRRVLIGLILSGVILLAAATVSSFNNSVIFWSAAPFCATIQTDREATRLAVAWGTVLLYDVVIFFLTALRAFRLWNAGSVLHTVLRDGLFYFCALSAVNIVNIVNFVTLLKPTFASLTNALSVTLISRLMLNLRSNADRDPSLNEDIELHVVHADLDTVLSSDVETRAER